MSRAAWEGIYNTTEWVEKSMQFTFINNLNLWQLPYQERLSIISKVGNTTHVKAM
jgi:hypothetical protein